MANKCQMSSDVIFCINGIKKSLNTKCLLHSSVNFMFLVKLVISQVFTIDW